MDKPSCISSCDYLKPLFIIKERNSLINECVRTLKPIAHTFEAIAVQGYSMTLFTPVIAHKLHKPIIVVRKRSETSHSGLIVEGPSNLKTYIIIDDLISSGNSIKRIQKEIKNELYCNAKCVGIYLYRIITSTVKGNTQCKNLTHITLLNTVPNIKKALRKGWGKQWEKCVYGDLAKDLGVSNEDNS